MSGAQFVREFATHMVADHQKDTAEYKKATKTTDAAGDLCQGNHRCAAEASGDRQSVGFTQDLEPVGPGASQDSDRAACEKTQDSAALRRL
jgi:hypothetical protein